MQSYRDDKQKGVSTAFSAKSETPGTPLGVYNPNLTNPEEGTIVLEYSSGHYNEQDIATILNMSDVVIVNYGASCPRRPFEFNRPRHPPRGQVHQTRDSALSQGFQCTHQGATSVVPRLLPPPFRAGLHYSSMPMDKYGDEVGQLMKQLEARHSTPPR